MGDCPGAGSGDPRDYEQRSSEEIRSDNIAGAKRWIEKQGFEVVKIGIPQEGEFFVNYEITERHIRDCNFHWFVPDGMYIEDKDRRILQAEYIRLYGTDEMATNFNEKCRYYIVRKTVI